MEKYMGNEMSEQAVFRMVRSILAEQFDYEADRIDKDTSIINDLGADSLDIIDLLMAVEEEYEITIPNSELEYLRTVDELVHCIVFQAESRI